MKTFETFTKSPKIRAKPLKYRHTWRPTCFDLKKWSPKSHEEYFFWKSSHKRSSWENIRTISNLKIFREVWENSGKNPSHPRKFACSYTYALQHPKQIPARAIVDGAGRTIVVLLHYYTRKLRCERTMPSQCGPPISGSPKILGVRTISSISISISILVLVQRTFFYYAANKISV